MARSTSGSSPLRSHGTAGDLSRLAQLSVREPALRLRRRTTLVKLVPMSEQRQRVIVDPAVQEAEDVFQRMMARLRKMTPEDLLRWQIERGYMNPDGTPRLPEGDPCVTLVR